jgi:hypothetical protein
MKLYIPTAGLKCVVDGVYSTPPETKSPLYSATYVARQMNFDVRSSSLRGATIVLEVSHGGDAEACAHWVGEELGVNVTLSRK